VIRPILFAVLLGLAADDVGAQETTAPPIGSFFNATAKHYQVLAQNGSEIAWQVNGFMNEMLRQYSRHFSNWAFKDGARVIVFSNAADFRAYAAESLSVLQHGLTGYCGLRTDAEGNTFYELVTYEHDRLWQVLAHEGFHQFLGYEIGLEAPIWLNEGLAQYFETSTIRHGRLETGLIDPARLRTAQVLIRIGRSVPVGDLLRMDQETFYAQAQVAYPLSWALVYYLMTRDGPVFGPSRFRRYLHDLKYRRDALVSFQRRFGHDSERWENDFQRYILRLRSPDD